MVEQDKTTTVRPIVEVTPKKLGGSWVVHIPADLLRLFKIDIRNFYLEFSVVDDELKRPMLATAVKRWKEPQVLQELQKERAIIEH